jgi:hypothetical protein
MTETIENDLTNLNATVKGTFDFPKVPNGIGGYRPPDKYDSELAEELIQDWWIRTTKSVGAVRFYAIPEVLKEDRRTQTPLHYHALFVPENPTRFMEVAPRKWENLLRHRFPEGKGIKPLWLEDLDRTIPESYEYYCLKNTLADWSWGRTHIITEEDLCPSYMRTIAT